MLASLPMYDWPEVRDATDALWSAIAAKLGVAERLERSGDYAAPWRDPTLLFSQTCGYPYTHEFRNRLAYVATPHYACDGCNGANYCSIVFAREKLPLEAFRGRRAAINTLESMSGMLALKLVFAPLAGDDAFFGDTTLTGGHIPSLLAVRDKRADVCAIDAVCVALARRYRPRDLDGLVEVARSPLVPGLPFVTSLGRDTGPFRQALQDVFADPALEAARAALYLSGLSVLPPTAYDRILDLEGAMERGGGLTL